MTEVYPGKSSPTLLIGGSAQYIMFSQRQQQLYSEFQNVYVNQADDIQ